MGNIEIKWREKKIPFKNCRVAAELVRHLFLEAFLTESFTFSFLAFNADWLELIFVDTSRCFYYVQFRARLRSLRGIPKVRV